jgi:hypothetical protein
MFLKLNVHTKCKLMNLKCKYLTNYIIYQKFERVFERNYRMMLHCSSSRKKKDEHFYGWCFSNGKLRKTNLMFLISLLQRQTEVAIHQYSIDYIILNFHNIFPWLYLVNFLFNQIFNFFAARCQSFNSYFYFTSNILLTS